MVLKGILIGIAKIMPGVSGSLLAISLGLYEKCMEILSNFNLFKKNLFFLFKFGFGILIGIIIGSKIITVFLNHNYVSTLAVFIGLIIGSLDIFSMKTSFNFKNILIFILSILLNLLLFLKLSFNIKINFLSIIVLGFIETFSSIVPGISGTAIFVSLNVYEFILGLYQSISLNTIFFGIGIMIGFIIIPKIINYFLKKYSKETYAFLLGVTLVSIVCLFVEFFKYPFTFLNVILILIGVIIARALTYI